MSEIGGAAAGAIRILEVGEDCTACGLCEAVAPAVFRMSDSGCRTAVRDRNLWERYLEDVLEAARLCPSGAIRIGEAAHG